MRLHGPNRKISQNADCADGSVGPRGSLRAYAGVRRPEAFFTWPDGSYPPRRFRRSSENAAERRSGSQPEYRLTG